MSRRRWRGAFAAAADPGECEASELACLGDERVGWPVADHAIGGFDRMRRICEWAGIEPDGLDKCDHRPGGVARVSDREALGDGGSMFSLGAELPCEPPAVLDRR
jgi:hypothetical protein